MFAFYYDFLYKQCVFNIFFFTLPDLYKYIYFSDCNPSFGYNNTISYILYNITCLRHVTTRVRNVLVRKKSTSPYIFSKYLTLFFEFNCRKLIYKEYI